MTLSEKNHIPLVSLLGSSPAHLPKFFYLLTCSWQLTSLHRGDVLCAFFDNPNTDSAPVEMFHSFILFGLMGKRLRTSSYFLKAKTQQHLEVPQQQFGQSICVYKPANQLRCSSKPVSAFHISLLIHVEGEEPVYFMV